MSDADDITDAYREGIDAARDVLFEDPTLVFVQRKSGQPDVEIGTMVSGWLSTEELKDAETDTLIQLEIVDGSEIKPPDPATAEPFTITHVQASQRVVLQGVRYTVETWNAPQEAPRTWHLFLREIKEGAPKR